MLNPEGEKQFVDLPRLQLHQRCLSFLSSHMHTHTHTHTHTDIDQLITISGMVIRTSPLIPEMREGIVVSHLPPCSSCDHVPLCILPPTYTPTYHTTPTHTHTH